MAGPTDAEIDAAAARGRIVQASEPPAKTVRYNPRSGRVVVELVNGCTFAFPARLAQGLGEASEEQISAVEILGAGTALH